MNKIIKLPKDFFTRTRPHVTKKEEPVDMIPFAWPDEVLTGKKEATLYSVKSPKK